MTNDQMTQCLRSTLCAAVFLACAAVASAQTPGAPSSLTVTINADTSITLQWTAPTTGGAPTGYIVQIGSAPGASDVLNQQIGNVTTFQIAANALAPGTYYFRVRALNATGVSTPSNEVTVTVACAAPTQAPSSVTWRASATAVQITWVPISGASDYRIEVGTASGLSNVAVVTAGGGLRTFVVVPLPGPGTYYARVKGLRSCGEGPASPEVTVVAATTTPTSNVLINEFNTFVELKNISSEAIDLSGWRIHTSSGVDQTVVRAVTLPGATILPGCTFLLAVPGDALLRGVAPDRPLEQAIVDGVALVRPNGQIVDAAGRRNSFDVASPDTPYVEGQALTARRDSVGIESFARAGDQDTNNNAADFIPLATANPQNTSGCLAGLPPGPPQNLGVLVTESTVELSWVGTLSGGPPRVYRIEAGFSPGTSDAGIFDVAPTITRIAFTSVPNGTYYVRVRAVNDTGVSTASNEVTVVVCAAGCTVPPGAVTQLTFQVSGNNVLLTWRGPTSGTAPTGYLIEAGTGPGLANLARFPTGSTSEFVIVSGVPPGTYYVRVRALRGDVVGPPSNEVVIVVQ